MTPRLTVFIPTFNREAFLDEAVESVLAQDFTDFELLLVDDASTDGTPELLRGWAKKDPRIVLITAPGHLGLAGAPNLALKHARAEYVARLDSDDVMTPGRLSAQLGVLEQHPDVVLVSTAYELIDRDGHHLGTWREQHPHEIVKYFLNFYNIVGGGGHVMFRRRVVLEEGGYDASVPSSEDFDLWVRLLRRGRIVILPMIGMKQRSHGGRATFAHQDIKRLNWTAIMQDPVPTAPPVAQISGQPEVAPPLERRHRARQPLVQPASGQRLRRPRPRKRGDRRGEGDGRGSKLLEGHRLDVRASEQPLIQGDRAVVRMEVPAEGRIGRCPVGAQECPQAGRPAVAHVGAVDRQQHVPLLADHDQHARARKDGGHPVGDELGVMAAGERLPRQPLARQNRTQSARGGRRQPGAEVRARRLRVPRERARSHEDRLKIARVPGVKPGDRGPGEESLLQPG